MEKLIKKEETIDSPEEIAEFEKYLEQIYSRMKKENLIKKEENNLTSKKEQMENCNCINQNLKCALSQENQMEKTWQSKTQNIMRFLMWKPLLSMFL